MKLPETWVETTLGAVLLRVDEKFDPTTHPGLYSDFVGLENIESHSGRLVKPDATTENEPEILSLKTRFRANDILFGRLRPYLNKVHLAQKDGICSTEIWALRATPEVSPEFAAYYLRSAPVCERASQAAVGANLPRVTASSFDRISMPLPTLPEQQRIVEVLRQAEAIGWLRSQQISDIDKIAREGYYELFGHPAENARGFEVVPLVKLGDFDRGMSKHRPRDAAHLFDGPYPFIQTGDVTNAGDWITEYSSTYSEAGLAQSKLWPKGTLCITIAANIARAAILDFDACFPDSVVGFTPHVGIHTEYVLYCLRFYQEFFEQRAPKSAQMNINLETLRSLRVPKPPESLQARFARFVREIRRVNDGLHSQKHQIASMLQQVQLAAFSGELTQKWRTHREDSDYTSTRSIPPLFARAT
jgi:type I restriction enzyme, S subunit